MCSMDQIEHWPVRVWPKYKLLNLIFPYSTSIFQIYYISNKLFLFEPALINAKSFI